MTHPITPAEIIEYLRNGWELANRGNGWWLSEPRKPYQRRALIHIDDSVVDNLEKAGLITLHLPHNTLWAKLTPAA